jgi:hypothetical protein
MRDIRKLVKETVNPPKSPDELRFIRQHKPVLDDKTPQDEDSYTRKIKKAKRPADNEGDATYDKAYSAEGVDLEEKAESEAQAISARIALAVKRGKLPKSKLQGASKEMMKMSEKDLEDYTKTKKGAPYKVEEARVVTGGYRDDQGRYHPPKTREDLARDAAQKRKETMEKTRKALRKEETLSEDPFEEIPMMQRQLDFIAYAAEEISEYLEMGDDPEEWFQNKLAHIHGQMQNLHAYAEGEMRSNGDDVYESFDLSEEINAGEIELKDGSKVNIKSSDAAVVNTAMKEMKPANRKKMIDVMMSGEDGLNQVIKFAKAAV